MAFPQTPRGVVADIYVNGGWVPINSDIQQRGDVVITRGQSANANAMEPSTCRFSLNNRAGKYSPRNPLSPYYGSLGRNTPMRLGLGTYNAGGISGLQLPTTKFTDNASTPDSVALSITGDVDIQMETAGPLANNARIVAMKIESGGALSYGLEYDSGQLRYWWSVDGTTQLNQTWAQAPPVGHNAYRATHAVNNGAGGNTITFYTAPTIAGPWVFQVSYATSGITSIFDSTSALRVYRLAGSSAATVKTVQVRNGIGGTLVASPNFAAQTAGTTSFADAQANTWTIAGAASIGLSPPSNTYDRVRFVGEVSSWPQTWDTSGKDAVVKVQAAGITRRLGQGAPPVQTAIRSWVPKQTAATFKAVAYWPLEEGLTASVGAPAVGSAPMVLSNPTTYIPAGTRFGRGGLHPWLTPVAVLQRGDRLTGPVTGTVNAGWELDFMFATSQGGDFQVTITGTQGQVWKLGIDSTLNQLWITDPLGSRSANPLGFSLTDGAGKTVELRCTQSGANINYNLVVSANVEGTSFFGTNNITHDGWSGTLAGSLDTVARVIVENTNTGSAMSTVSVGHVCVFSTTTSTLGGLYSIEGPAAGFPGEKAADRITRLCADNGITLEFTGYAPSTADMGPQAASTLLTLLQECADADGGILSESRSQVALRYDTRVSLHNASTIVTASYAAHELVQPFTPVDDDQQTRNDMTVTMPNGGSARYEKTTGALNTGAPGANGGVGRTASSTSLNVRNETQAYDTAAWLVHLGTVDEARFPEISFNLASPEVAANASLSTSTLLIADVGARILVTGMSKLGFYDNVKQLVRGYTETLNAFKHEITFNGLPASNYDVVTLDTPVVDLIDSGSSTLAAGVTSTATSLSVAVAAQGDLWVTGTGLSIPIIVGGETMTATAISGTASPQTFTVTRSVNGVVKAQTSGTSVRLARWATIAL